MKVSFHALEFQPQLLTSRRNTDEEKKKKDSEAFVQCALKSNLVPEQSVEARGEVDFKRLHIH